MNLLRFLILFLIGYFIIRLIRASKNKSPKVRSKRDRKKIDPFNKTDIVDVSFTDVSEQETKGDEPNQEAGNKQED